MRCGYQSQNHGSNFFKIINPSNVIRESRAVVTKGQHQLFPNKSQIQYF